MKKPPFGITLGAAFIDKFLHEVYNTPCRERNSNKKISQAISKGDVKDDS